MVSEIIVVDTGSTDSTRTIAAGFGAKVIEFPWIDDFSAARNEGRRHATGDYIFWLDADDRLDAVNLHRLETLLKNLPTLDPECKSVFLMSCMSKSPEAAEAVGASHTRLFPNRPENHWSGRVHERVEFQDGPPAKDFVPTDVVIRHEGYSDPVQYAQKRFRNSRILEQEFVAEPDNVWNLFYLGRVRNWQGNMSEALRFLQRSIRLDPEGRVPTTMFAYVLAADSLYRMRRIEEALQTLDQGLSLFGDTLPLLAMKACTLREIGRLGPAEGAFHRLLALHPQQARGGMWVDVETEKWRLMLGNMYQQQGRYGEAEAEYRKAAANNPQCRNAWFLLSQLHIGLDKTRAAEAIIPFLSKCPDSDFEVNLLRAQVCVLDSQFGPARKWIDRAVALRPDDHSALVVLASLLFREGRDWELCREVHEKLLLIDPHNRDVKQRLEQTRATLAQRASWHDSMGMGQWLDIHPAVAQVFNLGAGSGLAFSC